MAKGDLLGEFEQLVLLSLLRLGGETHGMAVRRELIETGGRNASIGAVYATLDRLESKDMVASHHVEAIAGSASRARRVFAVTAAGHEALSKTRTMFDAMWKGVQLNASRGK